MPARCTTGFDLEETVIAVRSEGHVVSENAADAQQKSINLHTAERSLWQHVRLCPKCRRPDTSNEESVRRAYRQALGKLNAAQGKDITVLRSEIDLIRTRLIEK